MAEAPGQAEEDGREASDVDARPPPVSDGRSAARADGGAPGSAAGPAGSASGRPALLLALADDLFVRSRIDAAAGAAGVEVRYIQTADEIRAARAQRPPLALLVGMAATRRPWSRIVQELRADEAGAAGPSGGRLYVLAFGPHQNLALRRQALDAGVDRVVANSAFVRLLPTILAAPTSDIPDE